MMNDTNIDSGLVIATVGPDGYVDVSQPSNSNQTHIRRPKKQTKIQKSKKSRNGIKGFICWFVVSVLIPISYGVLSLAQILFIFWEMDFFIAVYVILASEFFYWNGYLMDIYYSQAQRNN